jgi:hypothetical protein
MPALRSRAEPRFADPAPRVDCCVALGAELSSEAQRCGVADGNDWRLWLVRSSLIRSDNAWLAVRAPRTPQRPASLRAHHCATAGAAVAVRAH